MVHRPACTAPNVANGRSGSARGKSEFFEHQADDLYGRLLRRINESAIKVSTVRTPHQYMSAVGTKELDRILKEEFGIQPKDGVT